MSVQLRDCGISLLRDFQRRANLTVLLVGEISAGCCPLRAGSGETPCGAERLDYPSGVVFLKLRFLHIQPAP